MKHFRVIIFLMCLVLIAYFTLILAKNYQTPQGRLNLPFIFWVVDIINLYIHEAGHFFFKLFGRFLYMLGGTLFQIIIPVTTLIVFVRGSLHSLPFTSYWIGHNLVNISIYIADAPYRKLKLISSSALHDWHWILKKMDMMEDAETIASVMNAFGIFICIVGIISGLIILVLDIKSIVNQK